MNSLDKFLVRSGYVYDPSAMLSFRAEYMHVSEDDRQDFISKACSMAYPKYLNTVYWGIIRGWLGHVRKPTCSFCNSPWPTPVHHVTYIHRGMEFDHIDDLQLLCNPCHMYRHELLGDAGIEKIMKRRLRAKGSSSPSPMRLIGNFQVDIKQLMKRL